MRCASGWFRSIFLIFTAILISSIARAQLATAQLTIQVDASHPDVAIPADFTGLSFEVAILRPQNGVRYFRPDNEPLIRLFHTLGIKSLRIGGNTSDRDVRQLPSNEDLDSLFGFAKAAGVKVIYCLRLHNGDPAADAQTAKYLMDRYGLLVDCFSIGQEPSAYPVGTNDTRKSTERMGAGNENYTYTEYREDWKKFANAIIAAVPDVRFCGPSVHNNGEWARRFMEDFGHSNHVVLVTEHLYAGGAGGKVPSPEIGRDRMLSDTFIKNYEKLYNGFVPMALSNGLPYRLEEVNNYFNGGATNVSNTFASALWGLDFMYWWAQHHAAGLNFHTGDRVAAGNSLQASKYTAFFSTTNGCIIRPLGYGIKTFELGSRGQLAPLTMSAATNVNLRAYAVLGRDKNVYVTLINKEHGENAQATTVALSAGPNFTQCKSIALSQSANDVAATSGITLGGSEIKNDGSWSAEWKNVPSDGSGKMSVTVPAGSALLVRLSAAAGQ